MADPFSLEGLQRAIAASQATDDTQHASVSPDQESDGTSIGWGPYAALMAGNAADIGSTWQAIESGRGREGNPVLPHSPAAIMGLKAAATIPEALIMKSLADHGHPTAGKILGYAVGALGAGLAAHNSQVGR